MWFEWKRGTVCWGLAASVIRQGEEKSHLNSESSFANICRCLKCHFVDALFVLNVSFLFASVFFPQNFGIPHTHNFVRRIIFLLHPFLGPFCCFFVRKCFFTVVIICPLIVFFAPVTFAICCCLVLFLCCSNAIGGLDGPLYNLCIAAENLWCGDIWLLLCIWSFFFCYLLLLTWRLFFPSMFMHSKLPHCVAKCFSSVICSTRHNTNPHDHTHLRPETLI